MLSHPFDTIRQDQQLMAISTPFFETNVVT
jgi:hypothetical protein